MDITEQRRIREALRESEQRLADIIEFLPDATFAIDREGIVIAWNRAMEEMTGVKAPDIIGRGDYEYAITFYGMRRPILIDLILHPDDRIERGYYVLKKDRDLLIIETDVPQVKGQKAFLWAKASPLYDSRGEHRRGHRVHPGYHGPETRRRVRSQAGQGTEDQDPH